MQALPKISDRTSTMAKVVFPFIPQVLRQVWAYGYLSNHYGVYLDIISNDTA